MGISELSITKYNYYSNTYMELSADMKKVIDRIAATFNKKIDNDTKITIVAETINLKPGETFMRATYISKDSWSKVGYKCFTALWCRSCPYGVTNTIDFYDKQTSCFCRQKFYFTDTCDVQEKQLYTWNTNDYYQMKDLRSSVYADVVMTYIYIEDKGDMPRAGLENTYRYQRF